MNFIPAGWLSKGQNEVIVIDLEERPSRSVQGIKELIFETPKLEETVTLSQAVPHISRFCPITSTTLSTSASGVNGLPMKAMSSSRMP